VALEHHCVRAASARAEQTRGDDEDHQELESVLPHGLSDLRWHLASDLDRPIVATGLRY
jgi:hypothetical protein